MSCRRLSQPLTRKPRASRVELELTPSHPLPSLPLSLSLALSLAPSPSHSLVYFPFRSDLKPDNLLLDELGHVHLTDFNIAVHFSTSGRLLTGVAGSMAYMAPEVLAKKGYSCQIDWWSLGVIVYELMFGKRPFRGKTNSALTESIQGERLVWPEDASEKCSPEGMSAIRMVSFEASAVGGRGSGREGGRTRR